jgi:hypothetical protein
MHREVEVTRHDDPRGRSRMRSDRVIARTAEADVTHIDDVVASCHESPRHRARQRLVDQERRHNLARAKTLLRREPCRATENGSDLIGRQVVLGQDLDLGSTGGEQA